MTARPSYVFRRRAAGHQSESGQDEREAGCGQGDLQDAWPIMNTA